LTWGMQTAQIYNDYMRLKGGGGGSQHTVGQMANPFGGDLGALRQAKKMLGLPQTGVWDNTTQRAMVNAGFIDAPAMPEFVKPSYAAKRGYADGGWYGVPAVVPAKSAVVNKPTRYHYLDVTGQGSPEDDFFRWHQESAWVRRLPTYYSTGLSIDTDGIGEHYDDKSPDTHTSYMDGVLNADKHWYLAIPTNYPNYKDMLGCVGVVIDRNSGEYRFGVIGDGGNPDKYGEVSYSLAKQFDSKVTGNTSARGEYEIIYFPGTKQKWNPKYLNEQVEAVGKMLYPFIRRPW